MSIDEKGPNVLKRQYNSLIKKINKICDATIKAEKNKCSLSTKKMVLETLKERILESRRWSICKPLANALISCDLKTVDRKIQKQTNIINDTCLKGNSCRQKVLNLKRTISKNQTLIVQPK